MLDFRLKVFHAVAKRLNFTKAASELFITQPGVTKHIRELENQYKVSLLKRSGNKKITLTPAGQVLLKYTEQFVRLHNDLEYEMHQLNNDNGGEFRLGASTTVSQYIIAPILADFHKQYKGIYIRLKTANTEEIEDALLNNEIELGIVEGITSNPLIKYDKFLADEVVLVASGKNKLVKKDSILPQDLKTLPFVLREAGAGTIDVLNAALRNFDMSISDLNVEIQLGGTESIKSYLLHSNCFAFLSVHSIANELSLGQLKIIDIDGMAIERQFSFTQTPGQPSPLVTLFTRFAKSYKQ